MSYTLTQQILMKNAGLDHIEPGQVINVYPDLLMNHEMGADVKCVELHEMGFTKLKNIDRIVNLYDHEVPTCGTQGIERYHAVQTFDRKYGIQHRHTGEGICHCLIPEYRYCKPGTVTFGGDSHSGTYGACACFASGIGVSDTCAIMGTGELWLRVPSAIKIVIDGELPKGVYSKDIMLRILQDLRSDGATYKSLEFCGSTIRSLSMSARFTITNMCIECGAKNGIIEADETTAEYFNMDYKELEWLKCGPDDAYEQVIHYDAAELTPMIACPYYVDNVSPLTELTGTKITQVFFGSCTNSSLEDIEIFASIVRGKKIAPFLKLLVAPGTIRTYMAAIEKGYIQDIVNAGGIVTHPSCGLCYGAAFGVMDEHGVMVGTNNRNFLGRHGHKDAKCYLTSPATAAASALAGEIADPRAYL